MERTERQYPRFNIKLPIELHPSAFAAPLRAQTHDICMGGLYVELSFTQRISTKVKIALWIGDSKIHAKGVVVSDHPAFGNGIKFTELPDESRARLQRYLESLQCSGIKRSIGRYVHD